MKAQPLDAATAEDRVAAGVQFLTKQFGPKWRKQIDKSTLDIENYAKCIDGQMGNVLFEALDCDASQLVACGFDVAPGEDKTVVYPLLTAAWKKALGGKPS